MKNMTRISSFLVSMAACILLYPVTLVSLENQYQKRLDYPGHLGILELLVTLLIPGHPVNLFQRILERPGRLVILLILLILGRLGLPVIRMTPERLGRPGRLGLPGNLCFLEIQWHLERLERPEHPAIRLNPEHPGRLAILLSLESQ